MKYTLSLLKRASLLSIAFYSVYLGKTALGVNISDKYSVPLVFKYPLMAADCVVAVKGNYCHHLPKDLFLGKSKGKVEYKIFNRKIKKS